VGAPVGAGGAPSRRTSTSAGSWGIQARPDSSKLVVPRSELAVVPRSRCQASTKQVPGRCQADAEQQMPRRQAAETRRSQAAEGMRGPPSGRAQEGRRAPDEINGSRPPESKASQSVLRLVLGDII
jgi:hypothetical protein